MRPCAPPLLRRLPLSGALHAFMALCFCALPSSSGVAAPEVTLVKDGRPVATIVTPEKNDHLRQAVNELTRFIEQAAGCRLPVKTEKDAVEGTVVLLGESSLTRALGIKEEDLPPEGFVIRTYPGKLVLVGDTETLLEGWYRQPTEGNLWAVYRFLEDGLGIRWYDFDEEIGTVVPETRDVVVSLDLEDAPFYPIRTTVWGPYRATKDYLRRLRMANAYGEVWANHTMGYFGDVYHETRPEIFAKKPDGTPALWPPGSHPKAKNHWKCYMDYAKDEFIDLLIDNHVAWYEGGKPEVIEAWRTSTNRNRLPNDFRISIAANDGLYLSHSPEARKLIEMGHDDRRGQASDYFFHGALKFARAMYERYPKRKVCILAYSSYALPPRRFRDFPPNVIIQFAVWQTMAMWKEPNIYKEHMALSREWDELTDNKVLFWLYAHAPGIRAPFYWPGLLRKWNRDIGERSLGAFINGSPPFGNHAYHHLNIYFGLRVMWDPDYDLEAGLKEYAEKMYGPAAPEMHEFFDGAWRRWEDTVWDFPGSGAAITAPMLYGEDGLYPAKAIARMKELLDKAAKRPDLTEVQRKRVAWVADNSRLFFAEADGFHTGAIPHHYAFRLGKAPVVDGDFDEDSWNDTPVYYIERNMQDGRPSAEKSTLRVGWTDDALYMAIENHEPLMKDIRVMEKDGGRVHDDECVEIYLDPDSTRDDYVHLMINAAGAKLLHQRANGLLNTSWESPGMELATKRLDDRWRLELKIPFEDLGRKAGAPERWVWNVFRHRTAGENRYYALVPTMKRGTKAFIAYPELVLAPQPTAFEDFNGEFEKMQSATSYDARVRKKTRFKDAYRLENRDGRRRFARNTAAVPDEEKPFHRQAGGYPASLEYEAVPVTPDLTFEVKIRLTEGRSYRLNLQGGYEREGKKGHYSVRLFDGEGTGEWKTFIKDLHGLEVGRRGNEVLFDEKTVLKGSSLFVSAPTDHEAPGEIDYLLLGTKTALQIKD